MNTGHSVVRRNRLVVSACVLGVLLPTTMPAAQVQGAASLRLPSVFADHMVLQRDRPIPIWGWAAAGATVSVRIADVARTTTAGADGRWTLTWEPLPAGGPLSMAVADTTAGEGERIVIDDILVGEVWVCSGQSNMARRLAWSADAQAAIAKASDDHLRLFTVQQACRPKEPADDCEGTWSPCTPDAAAMFSGVGYYFGRRLRDELDVPVGLIQTAVGGTPAESWTRREALATHPPSDQFARWWERTVVEWDEQAAMAKYEQQRADYEKRLAAYNRAPVETRGGTPRPPRKPSNPLTSPWHPSTLYNGMVAPLIPYAIRGAVWYQGESNASRADAYHGLFTTMIRDWRRQWGQGDFPFYFVQLADYAKTGRTNWAWLREAQCRTLSEPNTGMAVTLDIGDPNDIHPGNKRTVGDRLALWALAHDYGRDVTFSGPLYSAMAVEGRTIRLRFEHADGLTTSDGRAPGSFEIAGADRQFVPARAAIDGRTVVVHSDHVAAPVAVRYAWASSPEQANLVNGADLPASPFRTDRWPRQDQEDQP